MRTDPPRNPDLALSALEKALHPSPGMLVAFSGGVDSAVLVAVAHRVLDRRTVAFTADSPSMARRELAAAIAFAERLGVEHIVEKTSELQRPEYQRNDRSRCFWCKQDLFEHCTGVAKRLGLPEIAYGYTADDVGDYRPGHHAAVRFGVRSPLLEARLTKPEIRGIARALGFTLWDKPAAPCLSSRIPYGSAVSESKLGVIESIEDLLHDLDFRVCRARFDGTDLRIEVDREQIARVASDDVMAQISRRAAEAGVRSISVDPEGFRSGKLNQLTSL